MRRTPEKSCLCFVHRLYSFTLISASMIKISPSLSLSTFLGTKSQTTKSSFAKQPSLFCFMKPMAAI